MMPPFNRQVEVIVYGVPEWRYAGTGELVTARFFGDGTPDALRIKFNCPKHQVSTAEPTKIDIYDLSPELRASLRTAGAMVTLRVGHETTQLNDLFSGSLLASTTSKQGADIITHLYCLAGLGVAGRTYVSKTWGAGFKIRDAVLYLAGLLPNIKVDPLKVDQALGDIAFGPQGFSTTGLASEALDNLSRVYGFNWWIDYQVFNALKSSTTPRLETAVIVSAEAGNLFHLEPQLASPTQLLQSVSISCLLDHRIVPGGIIDATTIINPSLSSQYIVHSMNHAGDTHGNLWNTDTQTYVVVQGASAGKVQFPVQQG